MRHGSAFCRCPWYALESVNFFFLLFLLGKFLRLVCFPRGEALYLFMACWCSGLRGIMGDIYHVFSRRVSLWPVNCWSRFKSITLSMALLAGKIRFSSSLMKVGKRINSCQLGILRTLEGVRGIRRARILHLYFPLLPMDMHVDLP